MILVLDNGWIGPWLCLRDTASFITTSCSVEKLSELSALGIKVVHFDLYNEETWSNLPHQSEIDAAVITLETVLGVRLPQLNRLWETHLASKPVICFSSFSSFQSRPIVDETTPLTCGSDKAGTGTDRVKGEELILSKGGTILHLSRIVVDGENNATDPRTDQSCTATYGPPQTIKSWLSKEYFKNGLMLLNCIHINDIYKIANTLIEKIKKDSDCAEHVRGQRILTSCGSFRVQDLARALNMELLPETIPSTHSAMENSTILCISKLLALLPEDYEWALPVPGVEPVSRGLPTSYDRQWELFETYYDGKWQGKTARYKSTGHGGALDHSTFIDGIKAAQLPIPVSVDQWEAELYFPNAETAIWQGTGQRFPQGKKILEFRRKIFNDSGIFFCFEGSLGHTGVNTSSDTLLMEVNFFYQRSRSTIVVRYTSDSNSDRLLLAYISITPFRCGLGCEFPLKPPQDQVRGSIDSFIRSLEGKSCHRQWRSKTHALDETDGGELCRYPTSSIKLFSDPDRVIQLFDDDIACSIPSDLPAGGACELVFGCFHTPDYAQMITLTYDSNGKIERCTLEKWT